MDKQLHIVTHDVPWPVDFGGVFDLFYKIRALHERGVKIHLHCFQSKRPPQPFLERFCASVHYYPRKRFSFLTHPGLPYIVSSRSDKALKQRLNADSHPVLLEGIHCTFPLHRGWLNNRRVAVRLHNVEYTYYEQLARSETHVLRKAYYTIESALLKRYEKKLARQASFWALSHADMRTYNETFQARDIRFLPVFTPWKELQSQSGFGTYCLYHGNLSVSENHRAATWLLEEVFHDMPIPFVIAGNRPSPALVDLAHRQQHTCIVETPSEHEMEDLIRKAHINLVPSFNQTGIKLKLVNALFNGKYCLTNSPAVEGTTLKPFCITAEDAPSMKNRIRELFQTEFTQEDLHRRKEGLEALYRNEHNADQIISWLW